MSKREEFSKQRNIHQVSRFITRGLQKMTTFTQRKDENTNSLMTTGLNQEKKWKLYLIESEQTVMYLTNLLHRWNPFPTLKNFSWIRSIITETNLI